MNSIAILYSLKKHDVPNSPKKAEVHINLWKLPNKKGILCSKKYERFIDFGIMVEDEPNDVETILLYLPFAVKKEDISDLGTSIAQSPELLCTLFNCDLAVNTVSNEIPFFYISSNFKKRDNFWIYELDTNNFFTENQDPNSTILRIQINSTIPATTSSLSIPVEEDKKNTPTQVRPDTTKANLYIRFRIRSASLNKYNYIEKLSNDFLQNAFSKAEIVDFRINDKREIDRKIQEIVNKDAFFFKLSKVNFFFIGSSKDETIQSGSEIKDSRLLENQKWKPYLNGIENDKGLKMLAYHWNKKPDTEEDSFDSFNLFFKTVYSSLTGLNVLKNAVCIIILGFLGSILATGIVELIKKISQ